MSALLKSHSLITSIFTNCLFKVNKNIISEHLNRKYLPLASLWHMFVFVAFVSNCPVVRSSRALILTASQQNQIRHPLDTHTHTHTHTHTLTLTENTSDHGMTAEGLSLVPFSLSLRPYAWHKNTPPPLHTFMCVHTNTVQIYSREFVYGQKDIFL